MNNVRTAAIRVALAMRPARDDDRGASLVEYALLVALIAIVCIAALTALGETVSTSFSEVDSGLD